MHSPSSPGRRPIAIDLFAGAGGFSLGIEQAGFDVLAAIEFDPIHAAVHQFNFPLTEVIWADATTLTGEAIQAAATKGWETHRKFDSALANSPWDGEIDLIVGGPPCQGFSAMGKRLHYDVRNDLVFHFCRLVAELQPRYFVMENVPGMTVPRYDRLWEELIQQFEQAGYSVAQPIQILNAADFGVPQERRRLFLLGTRSDQPCLHYAAPINNEPTADRKIAAVTVWDAIADLPNLDDFPALADSDAILLSPPQFEQLIAKASPYARRLRDLEADPDNFSYPRLWNPKLLTSSRRTVHNSACVQRFHQTPGGQLEPKSRLRRLDKHQRAHTLRAGTGSERGRFTAPRPIHPTHPRAISVREAARLHAFPDWFRFHVTKWHGFRQVGNAVPPLLGRAVARQVIVALGLTPTTPSTPISLGNPSLLNLNRFRAIARFSQKE